MADPTTMQSPLNARDITRELHAVWCRECRVPVPYDAWRCQAWEDWLRYVLPAIRDSEWPKTTPEALLITVLSVRRNMARGKPEIWRAWTALRKITGRPDECVETWCAAMAEARPRPQFSAGKADVLRATGRPDEPEPEPAKPAREVIARYGG